MTTPAPAPSAPSLTVALAAYPVSFLKGWNEFEVKLSEWVGRAAAQGAGLLVFPEYAPLEMISLLPPELHHDVLGMRPALQEFLPGFLELHAELARKHGVCASYRAATRWPRQRGANLSTGRMFLAPAGRCSTKTSC